MHDGKGTDHRHRHCQQRDDRSAPSLQEQDHDQHHEGDGFEQRVDHRFDRRTHKLRRVIDHAVLHAIGHVLRQLGHRGADLVGDLDGVGTWSREDRDRHSLFVVEQRTQRVFGSAKLYSAEIAQARHGAAGLSLDDDVAELLSTVQTALRID